MMRGSLSRLVRSMRSLGLLRRNERGNVLILTAMGLPIMLGGAGFGVDTAQWYLWKRELQTAVDAAALSGAYSLAQGADHAARADAELLRNLDAAAINEKSITLGPWTYAGVTTPNSAVTVAASAQRALPFSSMFVTTAPRITARAVAAIIPSGKHCMMSLDETTASAVAVEGRALLRLGCGISSNSSASPAISLSGNAQVEASPLTAVGTIQAEDENLIGDSTIRPYATEQEDPFDGITFTGTFSNQTYNKNVTALPPGRYAGLDLQGNHTMSGVYVIDGGVFSVNGRESLTGTNVTIILKNGATMHINGTANVRLTASTSPVGGLPAGVLIYQDVATAGSTTGQSIINGNARLHLGGTIYLPKQHVTIDGNSEPTTECLLLVSKTMRVAGNTEIINSCPPGYVYPGNNNAYVARLVQ
jgi:Flp pilus assembly protein TadG